MREGETAVHRETCLARRPEVAEIMVSLVSCMPSKLNILLNDYEIIIVVIIIVVN